MFNYLTDMELEYHWRNVANALDEMEKYEDVDEAKFLEWKAIYDEELSIIYGNAYSIF